MSISVRSFGDGASLFQLEAGGVCAHVTNYGAAFVSLIHPDGTDVVLGFDDVSGYVNDTAFVGVIVGRYGNRIAHGRLRLNGETWELPCNDGPHHIHGGPDGFGKRFWDAKIDEALNAVTFTLTSPHLDQGYPGNLVATATYRMMEDGALELTLEATSDRSTVVNLVPHAYFNLAGTGDILKHEVKLCADRYTSVDDANIPTGEIKEVSNTPYDYRDWKVIDADMDINYALNGIIGTLRPVAEVRDPLSGRHMKIQATPPGLQLYSGMNLVESHDFAPNSGLCLEPQYFPDSPNHENFLTPRIEPGVPAHETITYRFV